MINIKIYVYFIINMVLDLVYTCMQYTQEQQSVNIKKKKNLLFIDRMNND